jgi:multiple sugar transport system substrate-binding protein
METLEFAVFDHGAEQITNLRARLDQFEVKNHIKVQLDVLPWEGAWTHMVQIALYKDGPDLSEMGSTWIGDFVHMNALRPYNPNEVAALGGEEAFLKPSWQSGGAYSDYPNQEFEIWGIPWLADVRVIAYRRDIYEQAGVDLDTAFTNLDAVEKSLSQLQDAGVEIPLVVPTLRSRIDLQMMASWIWGAGGRFLNEEGDKILFDQPKALRGFQRYFALARFLSKAAHNLNDEASNDLFFDGRAATAMGGHWLIQDARVTQNMPGKVGVVGIPPVAFVGGSHFVIWQHSRKTSAALKLIDFLAGSQTPPELYPGFGFPARLDVIENAAFANDPNYAAMIQAAKTGKTFSAGRLWGMMEKRLVDLVPLIWNEIFTNDRLDVDDFVKDQIVMLAKRLRMALKS